MGAETPRQALLRELARELGIDRPHDPGYAVAPTVAEYLGVAAELGAESVAFPAISTGIYRWPLSSAAEIAVSTVSAMLAEEASSVEMVRFVLRGQDAFRLFRARADELGPATG